MLRIILAAFVGIFIWLTLWLGIEKTIAALSPNWFGSHGAAFQSAIENGGQFHPDTAFLITQIIIALVVSLASGFLVALIASENKRAPLIFGFFLLGIGVLKAVMSWPYVPGWYHLLFTLILLPSTVAGGRLRASA